eukprot:TRINITY_DN17053_c0_g1_i1.p1 TRINITY_DN17053_c0_g1~~TRINITY_DN17053_c0_g1_i1.p1  ORF type:complete len:683 (+),score=140.84 TRINITY_DN17053_c0_g1_i1:204-2252(+)
MKLCVVKSGLFRKVDKFYHFVHFSFQEYLSSFFVFSNLIDEKKDSISNWINATKDEWINITQLAPFICFNLSKDEKTLESLLNDLFPKNDWINEQILIEKICDCANESYSTNTSGVILKFFYERKRSHTGFYIVSSKKSYIQVSEIIEKTGFNTNKLFANACVCLSLNQLMKIKAKDFNEKDFCGYSGLENAVRSFHREEVKWILENLKIKQENIDKSLLISVKNNDFDIFKILLENKANPNYCDNDGNSILSYKNKLYNKEITNLLGEFYGKEFEEEKKNNFEISRIIDLEKESNETNQLYENLTIEKNNYIEEYETKDKNLKKKNNLLFVKTLLGRNGYIALTRFFYGNGNILFDYLNGVNEDTTELECKNICFHFANEHGNSILENLFFEGLKFVSPKVWDEDTFSKLFELFSCFYKESKKKEFSIKKVFLKWKRNLIVQEIRFASNIFSNDSHNKFLLGQSCFFGNIKQIEYLFARSNIDLLINSDLNIHSLFVCSLEGHLEATKMINNISKTILSEEDHAIHLERGIIGAVYSGHLEVLKYLMNEYQNPNLKDDYGVSILVDSIKNNHIDCSKFLIEQKATITKQEIDQNFLILNVNMSFDDEIFSFFMDSAPNLNFSICDNKGWNCFHHSFHNRNQKNIEFILDKKNRIAFNIDINVEKCLNDIDKMLKLQKSSIL